MIRKNVLCAAALTLISLSFSCSQKPENKEVTAKESVPVVATSQTVETEETSVAAESTTQADITPANQPESGAAAILARKQVPILCYHQIRDWKASDSKAAKDYIVTPERFREQMKMLKDNGYNTILPDQLEAYLKTGAPLPANPIMLTFDDNCIDHYTQAAPIMKEFGYKGAFFIMTVTLGRPRYMTKAQVKELADQGHAIGHHTWDHQNVKKFEGDAWKTQIEKPKKTLEAITGKPVTHFASPFGLWRPEAIPELKSRGITTAYQLAGKRDPNDPLHSIRRIIASGYWSAKTLKGNIEGSF